MRKFQLVLTTAVLAVASSSSGSWIRQDISVGGEPIALLVADVTGDGFVDVVVADDHSIAIKLLRGSAAGTLQPPQLLPDSGPCTSHNGFLCADFDSDGFRDLLSSDHRDGSTVTLYRGNASATFPTAEPYAAAVAVSGLACADFNGDGHKDVALTGLDGTVTLLYWEPVNNGFSLPEQYSVGGRPYPVTIGDFDKDGLTDVITSPFDGRVLELTGKSGGGLNATPTELLSTSSTIYKLAAADFNGDQWPELIVPLFDNNTVMVMTNAHSQGLQQNVSLPVPSPISVATADFNQDGLLDIAVLSFDSSAVVFYYGNGNGGFIAGSTNSVSTQPRYMDVGDLNNDGKPDIAVTSISQGALTILYNETPPGVRVTRLEISSGPDTVSELSTNGYNCTASFSDGTTSNVSAYATWSITNTWASAPDWRFEQTTNLLTGGICTATTNITIQASYGGMVSNKLVNVTDVPLQLQFATAEHPLADATQVNDPSAPGRFRQEYFADQSALLTFAGSNAQPAILKFVLLVAPTTNVDVIVHSDQLDRNYSSAGWWTNSFMMPIPRDMQPDYYTWWVKAVEMPCLLTNSAVWAARQEDQLHVCRSNPVVLVHGIGDSAAGCWGDMERLLRDSNHFACVSFDYKGMTTGVANRATIQNIAAALHGMLGSILDSGNDPLPGSDIFTHSIGWATAYFSRPKIDVVAHSMGGLVTRAYMAGMAENSTTNVPYSHKIDKVVTLASPFYGPNGLAALSFLPGISKPGYQVHELTLGSWFMWTLHSKPDVKYGRHLALAAAAAHSLSEPLDDEDDLFVPVLSACAPRLAGESYCLPGYKHVAVGSSAYRPVAKVFSTDALTHEPYIAICRYLQDLPSTNGIAFADLHFDKAPLMVRCHDAVGNGLSCNVTVDGKEIDQVDAEFGSSGGIVDAGAARIVMAVPNFGKDQPVLYGIAVTTTNLTGGQLALVEITLPPTTLAANLISESFAQTYFHTSASSVDPTADPDHDGLSNYLEQQMGRDPTDRDSSIKLQIEKATIQVVGQNILFQQPIKTAPGFHYQLEARQSPNDPWSPASDDVLGTGARIVLEATNPAGSSVMFRLRVH